MIRFCGVILLFLVSCSFNDENNKQANHLVSTEEEFVAPETPDHHFYVDDELVPHVELEFGTADSANELKPVLAKINEEKFEVLKYEGTLMKASGNSEGYLLRFEPYNHYDHSTEQEMISKYDFYLDVQISREQNKKLGFVINSEETNNLEWDYLENLFQVYYYVKDGKNYPLKFVDQGKTDWDG